MEPHCSHQFGTAPQLAKLRGKPRQSSFYTISGLQIFGQLQNLGSPEDAAVFCALAEEAIAPMRPLESYIENPSSLPHGDAARWFIIDCIRRHVRDDRLGGLKPRTVNRFLKSLQPEHQLTLVTDLVEKWGALGADAAMFDLLKKVTRL